MSGTSLYEWEYEELSAYTGVSGSWANGYEMTTENGSVTLRLSGLPDHLLLGVNIGFESNWGDYPDDTETVSWSIGNDDASGSVTFAPGYGNDGYSSYAVFRHTGENLTITFTAEDQEEYDRAYPYWIGVSTVDPAITVESEVIGLRETEEVTVTVKDHLGEPMEGVALNVDDFDAEVMEPQQSSVTTDQDGIAVLDVKGIAYGYSPLVLVAGQTTSTTAPRGAATQQVDGPRLQSVGVASGATQTNVTGEDNWATVKKADGFVIVQASLDRVVTDEEAARIVDWEGGEAVEGKPLQRKVSTAQAQKTTVKATVGNKSDKVDVWVIWASVTIKTTGTTPTGAVQFGNSYDGTETLGPVVYDQNVRAVGKVVPIAKLEPAGVGAVLKAGWGFHRTRQTHSFNNGFRVNDHWDDTPQPDDSDAAFQRLIPDGSDQIYDRDAPMLMGGGGFRTMETYVNFRQWVTWNNEICSDYGDWHFQAWWNVAAAPKPFEKVEVDQGLIELPDEDHAHYPGP